MGGVTSWVGDVFGGGNKKAEKGRQQQEAAYKQALADLQQQYGTGINTMRGDYGQGIKALQGANVQAGPSAFGGISVNPALRSAQMQALGQLQGEAAAGGLTAQDKAAQDQAMRAQGQQERGAREAIADEQARRGMAGGGSEFAAKLAAQQGSADRGAQTGTQLAANARQRALQAMSQAGGLAGQMEGQQFGQQAAAAQAADAINRFNAGQRLNQAAGVGQMYGQMGGNTGQMYGALGNQLASGQRSLGDMYAGQGQQKKQENRDTWGGAGDIVGGVLSFL